MIAYLAQNYTDPEIQEKEVERMTEHSVFLTGGRRVAKVGEFHFWAKSWQEAKDWLLMRRQGELASAQSALKRAEKRVAAAEALTQ